MSMAVVLLVVGMNTASFDKWSMTMRMDMKPLERGSCLMKSMLIEYHGRSGIGSGCRSL